MGSVLVNEQGSRLNRQAESLLQALNHAHDATEPHGLHQGSRSSVGWKKVERGRGKGRDVGFGFPAGIPPPPPPLFPRDC